MLSTQHIMHIAGLQIIDTLELSERNNALGLRSDVDHYIVAADFQNLAWDHGTFRKVLHGVRVEFFHRGAVVVHRNGGRRRRRRRRRAW